MPQRQCYLQWDRELPAAHWRALTERMEQPVQIVDITSSRQSMAKDTGWQ
jgi:hypothetical protein